MSEGEAPSGAVPSLPVRHCEWCGAVLPDDDPERKFCKPTHRTNAKRERAGKSAHRTVVQTAKHAANKRATEERRREACEKKYPYPSPQLAEKVIRRRGGIGLVYPCGDHWHVTRRPVNAPKKWREAYPSASALAR